MFYIPAVLNVLACAMFTVFASGQSQTFDSKTYKKKYCFLY